MLSIIDVALQFDGKYLFKDVNVNFVSGHCYGIIGANGAGKTTLVKVISKEIEPTKGEIFLAKGARLSVLKQDHFLYQNDTALEAVIKGYPRLVAVQEEKDALYAKEDFSLEDGIKASELELEYANMDGYESESNASALLNSLGIKKELHFTKLKDLNDTEKTKVLLAQALFGRPDILLLDEPTNSLDPMNIRWLENFIMNYEGIVIIVSHDRHFLNKVCTRILDIDYQKVSYYVGNYDFWLQSSELVLKQRKNDNMKKEQKMRELQDFIARFSANASKSKQATSRKKELEKINLEDIQPSSRRYPFIDFKIKRDLGNDVLSVSKLSLKGFFMNVSFNLARGDKVAFLAKNRLALTKFFEVLNGKIMPTSGEIKYGVTVSVSYVPIDNSAFFLPHYKNLIDWIRPYTNEQLESTLRGFLGQMLFTSDDALKAPQVLSGGEKVRMMLLKAHLEGGNVLFLDEPTDHLDLESIVSLNKGLTNFKGTLLLISKDQELLETVVNRYIFLDEDGYIDRRSDYNDFIDLLVEKGKIS
ncbi:MAG: ATP-binding cassette domain-containing protein [Erysipelotrichaceae bacterium]|jgi:ATPase subunit of ABC transporter with duplicated ATPase domains|nr:ATP-binding cassette domain-containing protein [Erysipelotrichaceae bacterium]